jgi:site-specific recombinase XerD
MVKVADLVATATQTLHEQKFCDDFIRKYVAIWRKLQVYAQKYRIDEFSWDLARTFLREEYDIDIEGDDIYSADCKKTHYTTVRPLLYLLLLQNDVGLVRTTKIGVISLESFSEVLDRLTSSCMERHLRKSTIEGKMWTIRPFLMYLKQNGVMSTSELTDLRKDAVSGFVQFLTARALNTVADKINVLRNFLQFLYEKQFTKQDLSVYVPKASRRKQRLAQTWTPDETERLLNAIERGTSVGKRDYAIFMLAIHLGMRSGDILSLKFENIDWSKCSIHFTQEKTGIPQELPLSEEIGKAIIDYLKHGRPEDSNPYVFVRHTVPYGKMTQFWYPMQKYLRAAHISVESEKPHGPHTLRFSLATHMMDAGIEYETISAVLGHSDPASTNRYLRADIEKLRLCALNPEGVMNNA